jgi:hypothetical protein
MNVLWHFLRIYVPVSVKRKKLGELCRLTACAFRHEAPELSGLSYREALARYAVFTRDEAEKAIDSGEDLEALKARLFENAYILGERLRKNFKPRTLKDVMIISRILYRLLGIDFQGTREGEALIRRCFFSSYYSGEICRIISSLDEGIAAGLSGGGRLSFEQRLTEGKDCCRAWLRFKENQ